MNPNPPASETGRNLNGEKHLLNFLNLAETHWQKVPQQAYHYAEKGLELAVKFRKDKSEYKLHGILGRLNCLKGDFFNSYIHLDEAYRKCLHTDRDSSFMSQIHLDLGDYYLFQNEFDRAIESYYQALNWDKESSQGLFNLKLANLFAELGQTKKALFHQKLCAEIFGLREEKYSLAEAKIVLGKIIREDGHPKEAYSCLLTALELLMDTNSPIRLKVECLSQMGLCHLHLSDFDKAYSNFRKALKLGKAEGLNYHCVLQNILIADAIEGKGHLNEAILQLNKTLETARASNLTQLEVKILEREMSIFEAKGELEKAFLCSKDLSELRKEIDKENRSRSLGRIQSNFESEADLELIITGDQRATPIETPGIDSTKIDIEQIAYIIAHDMKEPLRNICSFSELLANRYRDRLDEDADDYLDFIQKNSKHFYALLTDLMDFVSLKRDDNRIENVDLNEVFSGLKSTLEVQLEDLDFEFVIEELPTVKAGINHLTLLFQHLVQNAIRFRSSDSANKLAVSYYEDQGSHVIKVMDNGIGIEVEHQHQIFKIFNRLNKRLEGTGIGLSLCRKILDLYDGAIWVESTPGEGSTFFVSLPSKIIVSNPTMEKEDIPRFSEYSNYTNP